MMMRESKGEDWMEKGLNDDEIYYKASGGMDHGNIYGGMGAVIDKTKLSSSIRSTATNYSLNHSYYTSRATDEQLTEMRSSIMHEMEERDRKREEVHQREKEEMQKKEEMLRRELEESRRSQAMIWNMLSLMQRPWNPPQGSTEMRPVGGAFTSSLPEEWQNMVATGPLMAWTQSPNGQPPASCPGYAPRSRSGSKSANNGTHHPDTAENNIENLGD